MRVSLGSMIRRFGRNRDDGTQRDCRGGRFVAIIGCIANQNLRDDGAASFPAMNLALLSLCNQAGVGIHQMPCPEIVVLGFNRTRRPGTTIRQALETEEARRACADLASSVAGQLQASIDAGAELLAVLGGNMASPGCAVLGEEKRLDPASGVFMLALQAELLRRGIAVPFRGVRDISPELLDQDLAWLKTLFESGTDCAPGA